MIVPPLSLCEKSTEIVYLLANKQVIIFFGRVKITWNYYSSRIQ